MSNKTIVKLGLFFAGIIGLWQLWESDTAIDAIVVFSTSGIVPGTGIVLSPEQVYMVLGGFLVLVIMALFWKQTSRPFRALLRLWQGRALRVIETPVNTAATSVNQQASKPIVTDIEGWSSEPIEQPVVIQLPAQPSKLRKAWMRMRPHLVVAAGVTLELIVRGLQAAAVFLSRVSFKAYGYGMQAWLWAEPYLRRFDKRLERTVKRNKEVAAFLHAGGELQKTASVRFTELRNRLLARIPRAPGE